jgi:hypothetical protein
MVFHCWLVVRQSHIPPTINTTRLRCKRRYRQGSHPNGRGHGGRLLSGRGMVTRGGQFYPGRVWRASLKGSSGCSLALTGLLTSRHATDAEDDCSLAPTYGNIRARCMPDYRCCQRKATRGLEVWVAAVGSLAASEGRAPWCRRRVVCYYLPWRGWP